MTALDARTGRRPDAVRRPSVLRRAAVVATGLLAVALPTAWGVSSAVQIVTGAERDHLFHQLTGQGVLLDVLWIVPLALLVRAGWRGTRPGTAAVLGHVSVAVGAVVAAALAPGNGGALVAGLVVGTGALLWFAVPVRPRLMRIDVDPVLAPLALALAALLTPYALGQGALQRAFADEHARMSHYFDMAWLGSVVVVAAVCSALVPAARRLAFVAAAATLLLGGCRFLLTTDVTWSLTAIGLGLAGLAAASFRSRRPDRAN